MLIKKIRRRYISALVLVGLLVTLFTSLVQYGIQSQEEYAQLINIAGMQRMLSQKIALYVMQIEATQQADQKKIFAEELLAIIDRFQENQVVLYDSNTHKDSNELRKLYSAQGQNLHQRVIDYADTAYLMAMAQPVTPAQNSLFERESIEALLQDLNRAVLIFENDAVSGAQLIRYIELLLWITTIFVLILEAKYIFKPMERIVLSSLRRVKAQQEQSAQLQQQAESANIAKSQFLATLSHEFRTPMNGILGMLNTLEKSELTHEQKSKLATAKSSGLHLLNIISDVLDFSEWELGKTELRLTEFDLNKLFEESLLAFNYEITKKGLTFDSDINLNNLELVKGHPNEIKRVITHILGNALKFTEQGSIRFEATIKNAHKHLPLPQYELRCTVTDTGVGITETKQAEVFEYFTQADGAANRKHGGIGMGLAICKQLIGLMHGTLNIDSEEGKGTRVNFSIPLSATKLPESSQSNSKSNTEKPNYNGKRALIVEDNEINQVVLESILEDLGFKCSAAGNGKMAIDELNSATKRFDIIFMDCQMPVMDGYQTTKAIRDGEAGTDYQNAIIIAVTANTMIGDREKCLETGMNEFIKKPVEQNDLELVASQFLTS